MKTPNLWRKNLLEKNINKELKKSFIIKEEKNLFKIFYKKLLKPIEKKNRIISSNNIVYPKTYISNKIKNTNYNFFNFIPKFLFYQFNSVNNLYYLLLCISQFFKVLKIGSLISILFPLLFILFLSAIKEIYLEIKKYKKDNEINNSIYFKFHNNKFKEVKSKEIKVGDIIKINKNNRIPADILILWSENKNGITYIKTDQIDGETDWKLRKSLKDSQDQISKKNLKIKLNKLWEGKVNIFPPDDKIYDIRGNYLGKNNFFEKIRLENCIWSNMQLMTDNIIGLVLYVGKETKINLNSKNKKLKYGKLEKEINYVLYILFGIIFIFSFLLTIFAGHLYQITIILHYIKNLILISSIIPISLKANIDIAKIFYTFQINNNKNSKGIILKNSNISEEWGRVEYLLSDKTGTLTKNEMNFKKFSLNKKTFTENEFKKINDVLFKKNNSQITINSNTEKFNLSTMNSNKSFINNEEIKNNLITFFECLILCNNVIPVNFKEKRELQAASPDEISFVNFAEKYGYKLLKRNERKIIFKDHWNKIHEYEIIEIFPFSSERKRMGILLKKNNIYRFLIKGADCVINNYLNNKDSLYSYEKCEIMSNFGLRTLVFGENYINKEFYDDWKIKYLNAQKLKNSNEMEEKIILELEKNIKLVGITGVEDLLQDDVKKVIHNIREANIKVWMVTGDKVETAKCISISTGFKNNLQNFYEILENDKIKILNKLKNYNKKDWLVIPGSVLEIILNNKILKNNFIRISSYSQSVIICRCSPKQKEEIALIIKNKLKKIVCCIGDGGNDVGMIKSASFGIGIEGLEGKQAALAADASILNFKDLEDLLFWYGRLNYLRTCKIFHFSISRGFIITCIQIFFMFLFYFVSISLYNSNLKMMYSSIYTSLLLIPIVFDKDIPKNQVLNYPILYKDVQNGIYLNLKQLLKYICINTFQSFIWIFFYLLIYQNEIYHISTITFSSLILIEIINTFLLLNNYNKMIYIFSFISLIIYIFTSIFFSKFFGLCNINFIHILIIIFLSFLSTSPIILFRIIKFYLFPNVIEKIQKEIKNFN